MTLTIDLSDEELNALAAKAQVQGISAEHYAKLVLEHGLKGSPMSPVISQTGLPKRDQGFEPIAIRGESLSAKVLRERR
jgi:predicted alpha/beta-fold hydrolase